MDSQVVLYSFLPTVIGAGIIITLERIFPYQKNQPFLREGFFNDFLWYTLVQSYVLGVLIGFFIEFVDTQTGISRWEVIRTLPIWLQVVIFTIVHDFYIYWFHRLQHNNPVLWRLHEAHHSTPDVDWLSGSRSHSLEIMINQTVEYLPLVLLAAPEVAAIKGAMDAVWGMYIHSNINVRSGVLQYIINGPEMHRWHHANQEEAYNTNYSTKIAIWDWIFGTAFFPRGRKPERYGLDDSHFPLTPQTLPLLARIISDSKNYILQHLYAFRKF